MTYYSNTAVTATLDGDINDSVQTLDVNDATGFPEVPFNILIDDEVINVGAKASLTFSSLTRGHDNTTPAAHTDPAAVKHVIINRDLAIFQNSWLSELFERPNLSDVHTDDDEFDDATVSGWTQVTPTGTNTLTEDKGRLSMLPLSNSGNDACGVIKAFGGATTFPMTIETAVLGWGVTGNYIMHGLVFSDGTTTGSLCINSMPYSTGDGSWINSFRSGTFTNISTDYGATTVRGNMLMYQRLIWSAANTFKYQMSNDGVTWYTHAGTGAKTMTPTHYGMWVSNWGGGGTNYRPASFEYFRVTESDLSL